MASKGIKQKRANVGKEGIRKSGFKESSKGITEKDKPTKDHVVSDQFIQRLNSRSELSKNGENFNKKIPYLFGLRGTSSSRNLKSL